MAQTTFSSGTLIYWRPPRDTRQLPASVSTFLIIEIRTGP